MFTSPTGIAVIETISGRSYSLARYTGLDTQGVPAERYNLVGSPNVADCLAVLPAGFSYSGGGLPADPSPPPSVTAWQVRRWLLSQGISLAQVDAAIDAIPDAAVRESVRVDWEYAPYIEKTHPALELIAAALGIRDLDAAFVAAEKIVGPTLHP